MSDQASLDHQVLIELRPPGGGPETAEEILGSLLVMRRQGVPLPPLSREAITGSLQRLAAQRRVAEQDGVWRFTPVDAAIQRSLF